jgi:hypothetical protein
VGYVGACLVGSVVARVLGPALFAISAAAFAPSAALLREVGWGLLAAAIDSTLVGFVAWRFLGVLRAMRLSLAGKLVVACTALLPLRAVVGLILESVLPG